MHFVYGICCSSTDTPSPFIWIFRSGLTGYQKEIKEEAEEWFKRISSKVRKSGQVRIIKKVISTGASVVTEIASYADRKEIELIVIGATGKSGIRRLLLGSVSTGVVAHSHCSVLVVR